MRLLLFFLLIYFTFRYGKYLFSLFQEKKKNTQPEQTIYTNSNTQNQANSNSPSKPDDGEYVDFEEIKD